MRLIVPFIVAIAAFLEGVRRRLLMHRVHATSFGGTNCVTSGISRRRAVGPKKAAGRTVLHSTLCPQDIQDKSAGVPSGHPGYIRDGVTPVAARCDAGRWSPPSPVRGPWICPGRFRF